MEFNGGDGMSSKSRRVFRPNDAGIKLVPILVFVLVFLAVRAVAQNPLEDIHIMPRTPLTATIEPNGPAYSSPDSVHSAISIRKSVDLVLVPVTVTDPMQRLVTGLSQDNFQVFENKKQQEIKHFSSEDSPVSLGIILDTSRSMADKVERMREAVKQFCDSANLQDEFFLITFADQPHLVHDFTDSSQVIEEQIVLPVPKGRTALLDAIYMGIRKMREAKYSKKALLIISDGGDNHSRYSEGEVKSAAKESDVMIYAIGTFDRYVPTEEERLGPALLADLAQTTAGRAFILSDLREMPAMAHRIGVELRTQYILGYRPENPSHDGKWHKIIVKLKLPKKLPYLQARAKKGYYAESE
jgi:Ca-activated chloride channel homolog